MLAFGNSYDPLNDNHHNNPVDMDSSLNYRAPVFSRHGQTSAMAAAVNSGSQFSYTGNWFGGSGYYHNAHPCYHPSPIQQHQMLSIMQENAQNSTDPNLIPWSHNHHQHQNFEWVPPLTSSSQCQMSEYSADDSDISPSPASNRTISPSYMQPIRGKSPYEWMKKTSFQSEPSPGKTRTKDKYRVVYTDQQRVELEKEFLFNKYITIRRKTEMAAYLGLSERQVKIWFQNRRAKERKQAKKKQEMQTKVESVIHDRFDPLNITTL